MEIDQVKENEHPEEWSREAQEVTEEDGWWVVNDVGEINWVGNKGYGKSKGKGGQRFQQKGGKRGSGKVSKKEKEKEALMGNVTTVGNKVTQQSSALNQRSSIMTATIVARKVIKQLTAGPRRVQEREVRKEKDMVCMR